MKVTDTRPNGSIDAEPDSADGRFWNGLENAQEIAREHGHVVRFEWNGTPIVVAGDSDLSLIERQYFSRTPATLITEIGPYPDPATTPQLDHGTYVVEIG